MGVDSGLPDFRGDRGFWKAYPPYARLGLSFVELASPRWFESDPELAWGFYGHRLGLYRETRPHRGFEILRRWAHRAPLGAFVFTSNVDGQFQKAGFEPSRILECHGTIEILQCTRRCGVGLFEAPAEPVAIDARTMRAAAPLPICPRCAALARPNVLMFGDGDWDESRAEQQQRRMSAWLREVEATGSPLVVVECGAGTAVPTVRITSERLAHRSGAALVRINPREPSGPAFCIALAQGALEALEAIDARLRAQ